MLEGDGIFLKRAIKCKTNHFFSVSDTGSPCRDTSLSARTEVCILGYPISIERPCQKHTASLLQKFDEKSEGKILHHCWKESNLTATRNFCTWNIEVLSWKIRRKYQCPVQVVLKNDYEIFCHTYYFNMNIHPLCVVIVIIVSYLLKFNFMYVIHAVLILMTVMEAIYGQK